ncbi:hypothetical protein D5086_014176 [Populus alba]|uniref:Uncharacterized protein n=1 Tax=Populus alba TaxID=43335 RepID=A0ACC4BWZ2_POPAL
MCRGIHQERNNQGGSCGEEVVSSKATSRLVCCELCGSRASLYCQADDALLCQKCDKWVHGANFLARRHVRCMLCNTCQNLTQRYLIGASTEVLLPTISWLESNNGKNHTIAEKLGDNMHLQWPKLTANKGVALRQDGGGGGKRLKEDLR